VIDIERFENIQEEAIEYPAKNDEHPPGPGSVEQSKRLAQPRNNIHRKKLVNDSGFRTCLMIPDTESQTLGIGKRGMFPTANIF
jgi:hypothetical protein